MTEDDTRVRDAWNDLARRLGLSTIRLMNAPRQRALHARIKEAGLSGVLEAIEAVGESSFCCGDNSRRWQANFDFVLQSSSFVKLLEGHYRDRPKPREKFRNGALEILARESEQARSRTIILGATAIQEAQSVSLLGFGDD